MPALSRASESDRYGVECRSCSRGQPCRSAASSGRPLHLQQGRAGHRRQRLLGPRLDVQPLGNTVGDARRIAARRDDPYSRSDRNAFRHVPSAAAVSLCEAASAWCGRVPLPLHRRAPEDALLRACGSLLQPCPIQSCFTHVALLRRSVCRRRARKPRTSAFPSPPRSRPPPAVRRRPHAVQSSPAGNPGTPVFRPTATRRTARRSEPWSSHRAGNRRVKATDGSSFMSPPSLTAAEWLHVTVPPLAGAPGHLLSRSAFRWFQGPSGSSA